jgi:glycosyltransferase involved in cell wall biosynthesis
MKLGLLISGLTPEAGGAFSLESTILDELLEQDTNNEIFIYTHRDLHIKPKPNQHIIRIYPHLPPPPPKTRNLPRWILSRTLNRAKEFYWQNPRLYELVIEHKIDLFWFLGSFKPLPIPYVFTVLDCQHRIQPEFPEVSTYGWTWNDRENFFSNIRKATYIITGTKEGAKQIQDFYQPAYDRIRTIPIPVPQSILRQLNDSTRPQNLWIEKPFLFYPAQFWPHKNHATLLYALKIIHSQKMLNKPLSLVLCGSDKGNRSYIFRLVRELGLEQYVQMLPFINENEVAWLYDNAEAMVFPSLFGPDNLPPLEAFWRKCPVITSHIPGADEQLGQGPLYFEPYNENDLANTICTLIRSPEKRSLCIKHGLERINQRTPKDYISHMFQIINEFKKVRRLWGDNFLTMD